MTTTIVHFNDVSFRYDESEKLALEAIEFKVRQGDWISIVGHNGSGKSTIAKLLMGLLLPNQGELKIFNDVYSDQNVWDIRSKIGIVFQNPDNQFVGSTVEDDVAFSLENIGVPYEEMQKRVHQALELVRMADFKQAEPHHLSGGQKQRVAIAGAIALHPKLLILDEATSMLDPLGRREVMETIKRLRDEIDLTVISITHDLEEVLLADEVVLLNEGRLIEQQKPQLFFRKENRLEEYGLSLPFTLKMSGLLEQKELITQRYLSEKELLEALCKLPLKK